MSYQSQFQGRLLSRPLRVSWAGWESDTLKLQQAGWCISANERIASMEMEIAIQNRQWAAQGLSMRLPYDYQREANAYVDRFDDRHVPFGMRMGREVIVQTDSTHSMMGPDLGYSPVDAMPQWNARRIEKLEDLAHFAKVPLTRTQEIILPEEEDVNSLLERILEKQQGARRRYFEEQVREGQYQQVPTMHAQIITLRQAA